MLIRWLLLFRDLESRLLLLHYVDYSGRLARDFLRLPDSVLLIMP